MIHITSQFDGGNIICDSCEDPGNIQLRIRPDTNADFFQWFYFRLSGAKDSDCILRITNAKKSSYAKGWVEYRAVASYDRQNWFRIDSRYEDGELKLQHRPDFDSVYYAYFAPYSMERHADILARASQSPRVSQSVIGKTIEGQAMDLLTIGERRGNKRNFWLIARQHPGETMAEWWMEGFLDRLLDPDDAVSNALLDRAIFHVVPNMNPDGSRSGNLRTNAAGANLNREWQNPDMKRSPEVFVVREKMRETGVDFCLDVHGDEAMPHNFVAGAQGVPSWTAQKDMLLTDFKRSWQQVNPDFQTHHGYPIAKKGEGNMTICVNHVSEYFGCLAMTLEMPFKDTADRPDLVNGWSPARARKLGASVIDVIYKLFDRLKGDSEKYSS
ncbi:M14-type cytosolic carboxypeptidase [uncultured Sneathiella sp.]|uniref:M14 family metallopeptidase n=1 Tax=uncultured Sneathiella sp. TaxID=879315 RepID=UPI0025915EDF|nr:M14-type cytosolic carboxypeptidase [uncultured Sneathiella sp.]